MMLAAAWKLVGEMALASYWAVVRSNLGGRGPKRYVPRHLGCAP